MKSTLNVSWLRIKSPVPFCKAFTREVNDGHLTVIVGREPAKQDGDYLWHLSMSHRSSTLTDTNGNPLPGRIPLWEEIKEARYKFIANEVTVGILLPPKEEYVNVHPTTIHLWEVRDERKEAQS